MQVANMSITLSVQVGKYETQLLLPGKDQKAATTLSARALHDIVAHHICPPTVQTPRGEIQLEATLFIKALLSAECNSEQMSQSIVQIAATLKALSEPQASVTRPAPKLSSSMTRQ